MAPAQQQIQTIEGELKIQSHCSGPSIHGWHTEHARHRASAQLFFFCLSVPSSPVTYGESYAFILSFFLRPFTLKHYSMPQTSLLVFS